MKGKGEKGNRSSLNSSATEEGSLTLLSIKPLDHVKTCPQFTSIATKDESSCISIEELDSLQPELEIILTTMTKRVKTLQAEVQTLASGLEKGKDKLGSSPSRALTPQSTGSLSSSVDQQNHYSSSSVSHKRSGKGKSTEERPAKRMRTDSGRATYAQPVSSKGKGKSHQDSGETASTNQIKTPKNITPNRFWAMVEPYCTEITKDDLRFLEDQIKLCEDIGDCMKVPTLGKHYTEKWNEEDLILEQGEANKLAEKKKGNLNPYGNSNSDSFVNTTDIKVEKSDNDQDEASMLYGPLTQRLVQALLEVNTMNSNNDEDFMISDADAYEAATIPPKSLAKQLHIENPGELEKRIRKELHNQGILDSDDSEEEDNSTTNDNKSTVDNNTVNNNNNNNNDDENDEILAELKRKQSELKSLSAQNCQVLRSLLKMGREKMVRQDLRKKLAAADAEVEEAYRRVQAHKVKRKKEKDAFFKALQDRKAILKQLHTCENRPSD